MSCCRLPAGSCSTLFVCLIALLFLWELSFEGQILRFAVVRTPSDATHPQPQVGGLVMPRCIVLSRPTCVRENRINDTTCCPHALLLGLTGRVLCRGVWPVWGVAWSLSHFSHLFPHRVPLCSPAHWGRVCGYRALICPLVLSCNHLYSMPPRGLVRVSCIDVNGGVEGHKTRARAKFTKERGRAARPFLFRRPHSTHPHLHATCSPVHVDRAAHPHGRRVSTSSVLESTSHRMARIGLQARVTLSKHPHNSEVFDGGVQLDTFTRWPALASPRVTCGRRHAHARILISEKS
jgi:hypothetical protein